MPIILQTVITSRSVIYQGTDNLWYARLVTDSGIQVMPTTGGLATREEAVQYAANYNERRQFQPIVVRPGDH